MAIIIETCPKCGHDLQDLVLASYPPIPQKKCFGCGWEWTGQPEQIMRVPFGGNSFDPDNKYMIHGNTDYECLNEDCCMACNLNREVFAVSKDLLNEISKMNHNDINASIERMKKYIKEE